MRRNSTAAPRPPAAAAPAPADAPSSWLCEGHATPVQSRCAFELLCMAMKPENTGGTIHNAGREFIYKGTTHGFGGFCLMHQANLGIHPKNGPRRTLFKGYVGCISGRLMAQGCMCRLLGQLFGGGAMAGAASALPHAWAGWRMPGACDVYTDHAGKPVFAFQAGAGGGWCANAHCVHPSGGPSWAARYDGVEMRHAAHNGTVSISWRPALLTNHNFLFNTPSDGAAAARGPY
eukprot:gene30203-5055_t